MSTRPKNWKPARRRQVAALLRRRRLARSGLPARRSCRARSGRSCRRAAGRRRTPRTGAKSWNRALPRVVVVRGGVVHVRGQPDGVGDAGARMWRSRSAISSSRPRGGPPSPLATASAPTPPCSSQTTRPIGMSQAMTFQVARGVGKLALQPGDLVRAEDAARVGRSVCRRAVRAAVGAQVEEEDVEQRTVGDLAVDPAGLGRGGADRGHLVEGAGGAGGEERDRLLGVAGVGAQVLATATSC